MEQAKVIKCGCGLTNHLVLISGVWCYDSARHGKIEPTPVLNRCANCQQPLEQSVVPAVVDSSASIAGESGIEESDASERVPAALYNGRVKKSKKNQL